jgi:hypothetical protein
MKHRALEIEIENGMEWISSVDNVIQDEIENENVIIDTTSGVGDIRRHASRRSRSIHRSKSASPNKKSKSFGRARSMGTGRDGEVPSRPMGRSRNRRSPSRRTISPRRALKKVRRGDPMLQPRGNQVLRREKARVGEEKIRSRTTDYETSKRINGKR